MTTCRLISLSLAAAMLVSVSAASEAADAVRGPAYRPAPPPFPLIYNWTGFYAGGHLGVGWAGGGGSGFLGGGQVGFNYQVNPQWVVGVEADIAGTTIKDNVNASFVFPSAPGFPPTIATTGASVSLDYAFDRWLVYGKAGGAWAHASANISASVIIPGVGGVGGGGTIDQTVTGWVFGVGTEYALRDNWTAKVEYNMMDFGNNNPFSDNTFHVLKAGINYHFGGLGGPF
jgi:outer membrane immunogenic protein